MNRSTRGPVYRDSFSVTGQISFYLHDQMDVFVVMIDWPLVRSLVVIGPYCSPSNDWTSILPDD